MEKDYFKTKTQACGLYTDLIKIVKFNIRHVLRDDENLQPRVLQEEFDEALGAERVVHEQPVLLISPEIQRPLCSEKYYSWLNRILFWPFLLLFRSFFHFSNGKTFSIAGDRTKGSSNLKCIESSLL